MKTRNLISLILLIFMFGGCVSSVNRSSSVVDYLYPNEKNYAVKASIPHLNIPLKVGIAFVPESVSNSMSLTEVEKVEIMSEVSENFKKYDFIKSIEMIPSSYLIEKGSFSNLNQIKKMFNIDVIALVSFDQTQFTNDSALSFTYWTIIGAYIVPAEKNDTHTMLDTVVYDIDSKKMLFRAPGVNKIKSRSSIAGLKEQLKEDRIEGFKNAREELTKNLELQLVMFKEKVKANPQDFNVTKKEGYTGGGSIDKIFFIFLVLIFAHRLYKNRNE